MIGGKTIEVEARPADVTWRVGQQQQNMPDGRRVSRNLVLAVRDALRSNSLRRWTRRKPAGEKVDREGQTDALAGDFKGPVQVTLLNRRPQQMARSTTTSRTR